LSALAVAALLVAACGSGHSTTALPKLPVQAAGSAPTAARARDSGGSLPGSVGTVEYHLGATLPSLPATTPAYKVASGSANDRHRIATVLGLADSDRHLFLRPGAGSWSFDANCEAPPDVDVSGPVASDEAVVGYACASATISQPAAGTGCGDGSAPACTPEKPPVPVRPADLPTREAAVDRARLLFHALGTDVPGTGFHVDDGITQWFVSADPVVDGLPTIGRTLSATIGPKSSILAAQGPLGTPTKIGDYPLVDAATIGFKRLLEAEANQPRPMMQAMPCRADVPNCGEPLTPQIVTIIGVHLALQQLGDKLVPVFEFEAGPNETVPPVPAVIDDLLQTTTPTVIPNPQPEPGTPQQPGSAPAGAPTEP